MARVITLVLVLRHTVENSPKTTNVSISVTLAIKKIRIVVAVVVVVGDPGAESQNGREKSTKKLLGPVI